MSTTAVRASDGDAAASCANGRFARNTARALSCLLLPAWMLTACSTSPKPTAVAEESFDEFHARMLAQYSPDASPKSSLAATSSQAATNASSRPINQAAEDRRSETNKTFFALPPPFLQLPEQKAFREEVERSGVSPTLVEKMLQGTALTLEEIQELSQKQVSPTNIIKYLRTSGASYTLTSQQIDELRAGSVSREVIDYLLTTPALRSRVFYYPAYPYYPRYLWWDHHHYDFHHDFHHGWHH